MATQKIGSSLVRDTLLFRGLPFSSKPVNASVLVALFADAKLGDSSPGTGEGKNTVATFKSSEPTPSGHMIRYEISKDDIKLDYLFGPQPLDDFAQHLKIVDDIQQNTVKKLVEAHGLPKQPEVLMHTWSCVSQGVPCIGWLKRQTGLDPEAMNLGEDVQKGWLWDWRPVSLRIAIQQSPDIKSEVLRHQLESASVVQVAVDSGEEWENGIAAVSATLRDTRPSLFIKILRAICEK